MVDILTRPDAVDHEWALVGLNQRLKICIFCFSAKHAALRSKNKAGCLKNQDEWVCQPLHFWSEQKNLKLCRGLYHTHSYQFCFWYQRFKCKSLRKQNRMTPQIFCQSCDSICTSRMKNCILNPPICLEQLWLRWINQPSVGDMTWFHRTRLISCVEPCCSWLKTCQAIRKFTPYLTQNSSEN
jgi:hypothetical protein